MSSYSIAGVGGDGVRPVFAGGSQGAHRGGAGRAAVAHVRGAGRGRRHAGVRLSHRVRDPSEWREALRRV